MLASSAHDFTIQGDSIASVRPVNLDVGLVFGAVGRVDSRSTIGWFGRNTPHLLCSHVMIGREPRPSQSLDAEATLESTTVPRKTPVPDDRQVRRSNDFDRTTER